MPISDEVCKDARNTPRIPTSGKPTMLCFSPAEPTLVSSNSAPLAGFSIELRLCWYDERIHKKTRGKAYLRTMKPVHKRAYLAQGTVCEGWVNLRIIISRMVLQSDLQTRSARRRKLPFDERAKMNRRNRMDTETSCIQQPMMSKLLNYNFTDSSHINKTVSTLHHAILSDIRYFRTVSTPFQQVLRPVPTVILLKDSESSRTHLIVNNLIT